MAQFRIQQSGKDVAGFVQGRTNETGATVLVSERGKNEPVLCQGEDDVITNAGYPSADYPSTFEAVAFSREAPIYIVCPYGTGSRWGGILVKQTTAEAFTYGQITPDSIDFTAINTLVEGEAVGTGNGVNATFSGVAANVPIDTGTLEINVHGSGIAATESGGVISGAGVTSGNINLSGGNYEFVLATVPGSGVAVTIDYVYDYDHSSDVSHVIMAASPYTDDLAIDLESNSDNQFKLTLYKVVSGVDNYIKEYNYSMTREENNFGKTLYYEDVFRNDPYLTVVKNTSFSLVGDYAVDVSSLDLAGGYRVAPEASDINTAWDQFQSANKYKARIFMDAIGGYSAKVNTTLTTYQPYAHGITPVSYGVGGAADAITERQGYSLNSDNMSVYTNWQYIKDPYNDSYAWINGVGSVGKKFAMMSDIYDSGSPAGIDEDDHGGILNDWEYQELEYDYSETELLNLDNAQINPIVWDQDHGVMAYGDKTAQSTLSDVSYIGHRRMYNFILETIINQVLKKQVFKNNDVIHRARAKAMIDDFIRSTVFAKNAILEWLTVCDTTNNTPEIMDQRKFLVDLYVKVTPNSQTVHFVLTRVGINQVIAELAGQ